MAKLKIDLGEKVAAEPEAPKIEVVKEKTVAFKQKQVCYWTIRLGKTPDEIRANSNLGDKFEGKIADFNRLLRE